MALWNPERPRYGQKLGVPPLKPISEVIVGMGRQQDERSGIHTRGRASGESGKELEVGMGQSSRQCEETTAHEASVYSKSAIDDLV